MANATCGMKPPSVGLEIPGQSFGGIPESLVVYGAVSICAVILYLIVRRLKCAESCSLGDYAPPFLDLVKGKEDEWLKKERGIGAWHFISFQRIIALFTTFLVIISTVSLAINLSHEDEEKSLLHRTASSNLPKGDAKMWYNVLSTFFIPWAAFALLQRLRRSVGLLKPDTSSYGTTLMLEPPNMSKEQLRSHFASRFPNCTLKSVDFGFSTQVVMQGTLSNIDFHSRVLKVLAVRGEEPPTCCQNLLARRKSRGIEFHQTQLLSFKAGRDDSKAAILAGEPSLLFLTFNSHEEAAHVKSEISSRAAPSCSLNVSFAPLPDEVHWNNLRRQRKKIVGSIFSHLLLVFLVLLCSTPAGFQKRFLKFFGEGEWLQGVAFLLPPLLLLFFGFLVPFSVKLTAVTFGSPSRPQSFCSYMTTLYFWLLLSTLIFPIVITGAASNLLDFGKELNNGGFDLWREKWQCVFAIDTGMFYISLIIVVTGLKNMLQLHRTGDWFGELFDVMLSCKSPAEVIAARERSREKAKSRSGNKLALADEYVWLVLYTTILLFFCTSCPLITVIFILYLVSKYLVDMVNWQKYYHAKPDQPELLETAAKLLLFASLFPQFNTTFFLLARGTKAQSNGTFVTSLALLLFNSLALLLYRIYSFRRPVPLFDHWQGGVGADFVYTDPLYKLESMTEEEMVELEGLKARTGGLLAHMQPATGAWFKQGGNRGIVQAVKSAMD